MIIIVNCVLIVAVCIWWWRSYYEWYYAGWTKEEYADGRYYDMRCSARSLCGGLLCSVVRYQSITPSPTRPEGDDSSWVEFGRYPVDAYVAEAYYPASGPKHFAGFQIVTTRHLRSSHVYIDGCSVVVPFWFIVILMCSSLAFLGYKPVRERRLHKQCLCVKCGYDLRVSKGRCPECGTEFREAEPNESAGGIEGAKG
jgi:hypothetical protein